MFNHLLYHKAKYIVSEKENNVILIALSNTDKSGCTWLKKPKSKDGTWQYCPTPHPVKIRNKYKIVFVRWLIFISVGE